MTKFSQIPCKICGQESHGFHFGVRACRACAIFFRRCANSKWTMTKCLRKSENRDFCFCRPCRLQKCLKLGMKTTNFQHDRDCFSVRPKNSALTIFPSPSSFLGRPEFLMFSDLKPSNLLTFIDVHKLVSEASRLLNSGCESPLIAENQLKKLTMGANFLKLDADIVEFFGNFGKMEFVDIIEYYFVTVIKWMLRFEEFQKLDRNLQMTLLNSIWHVFMKFHKCSATAMFRKANQNSRPFQRVIRNVCMDFEKAKMDTTWMSDYPHQYVGIYMKSQAIHEEDVIELIEKLNPTDVELTFMFAQTCFQYAGNRFQGEIMNITDRFQQILANDLHKYYTVEMRNPRYLKRIADLMKVNNTIQRSIWEGRPQRELNRVFNVLKIGFSHPQMFEDSAFCTGEVGQIS
ncbi:hypothetical protein L5515_006774 [Caenorhabditis briggsae]|uniref:Nuclear receptor domain-containing protein n=1 Tax=Caenorhabditis briggsae TaxID=6238 RepID=A0AAE9JIJ5_CAEBR|nr:hypothetical protein L5515_006774 [Caenorhabditis briggsae]